MKEFLTQSAFFGVFLSLITFQIGIYVRKKTKISFLTPLVTATAIVIVVLVVTGIDYSRRQRRHHRPRADAQSLRL